MALKFVKDNEVKLEWFSDNESYERFLSDLAACEKKHVVYLDELMQGIVLVEVSDEVLIKSLLGDDEAKSRLVAGIKSKYKNKDLVSEFFDGGRYCRFEHLEDAFLNDERLVERYPVKLSDKQIVWNYLIQAFKFEVLYKESQVNEVIKSMITFEDYVTIRRDLYDYGYLSRLENGAEYKRVK